MHLDNDTRGAFHVWIDDGCPDLAQPFPEHEDDHAERMTAEAFLRMFLGCTDIIPGEVCDEVARIFDHSEDARGMTYAEAASVLLARRVGGDDVGAKYLDTLLWNPMVTLYGPAIGQEGR